MTPRAVGSAIKHAWTLIELLVVIAIIAILAAILGVVASRTKRSAQNTACISNLAQIGKALQLYAGDNDTFVPPVLTFQIESPDYSKWIEGNPLRWRDCLARYTRTTDVFYCPADSNQKTSKPDGGVEKNNSLYTSYETVPWAEISNFGPRNSLSLSIDTVRSPAYAQDRIIMARNIQSRGFDMYSSHGPRMNVLYLQGNVKNILVTY